MNNTYPKISLVAQVSFDSKTGKFGIVNDSNYDFIRDLSYFNKELNESVVLMDRQMFKKLSDKPVENAINIVLAEDVSDVLEDIAVYKDNIYLSKSLEGVEKMVDDYRKEGKKIFIIGGSLAGTSLYSYFLKNSSEILLSVTDNKKECSEFFPEIPSNFFIDNWDKYIGFTCISYVRNNHDFNKVDDVYNKVISEVLYNGKERPDRTGVGTLSLFGKQMVFDITKSCPLLTCKRVAWKTCIKELLWFLRGETDAKIIQKQGVKIWDGNSSREFLDNRGLQEYEEGECGPIYGWQIRRSGAPFPIKEGGTDQLSYIENLLKNDPFSRRILWNLWNPSDLDKMSLTCCHYSMQLYVSKKDDQMYLSGMVNIRSNDLFLGNPFNIFSYYVLIRILCLKYNMKPLELILSIGDAHIYKNHIQQVQEQLKRPSRPLPVLELNPQLSTKSWEEMEISDFTVTGYFPHPAIKADMAV